MSKASCCSELRSLALATNGAERMAVQTAKPASGKRNFISPSIPNISPSGDAARRSEFRQLTELMASRSFVSRQRPSYENERNFPGAEGKKPTSPPYMLVSAARNNGSRHRRPSDQAQI